MPEWCQRISWETMFYDLSCRQVQQELAKPGQLEKFLGDKPQVKITFALLEIIIGEKPKLMMNKI